MARQQDELLTRWTAESAAQSPISSVAPSISLPKGGGAIRGIGEKFAANPVTGTASMTVPIATSPGRAGLGPQLALSYDSGAGNGPFGFGWTLSLPAVTRKTDKGLPRYRDAEESDVFMLAGVDDLVPEFDASGHRFEDQTTAPGYTVHRYRPRIEAAFARTERWTRHSDGDVHWRALSRENVLTIYGRDANSRIADPADPRRVFSWLISESRDDKGNAILYDYKPEDGAAVDLAQSCERNRGGPDSPLRTAHRHLKRIRYGNRSPLLDENGRRPPFLSAPTMADAEWLFEVVLDYGEHDPDAPRPDDAGLWPCRNDPFSSHRPGFELRTYRLCRRILMFHHFPAEADVGSDCLVRSTDFSYREDDPVASFLTSVTLTSYRRSQTGYLRKSLPPVDFGYNQPVVGEQVHDVDDDSLDNLPDGVAGVACHWLDLDGEGLTGVLAGQAAGWFYKRNESMLTRDATTGAPSARLAPVERIEPQPLDSVPAAGQRQFLDLAGDGHLDLVTLAPPVAGFHERDDERGWSPFHAFESMPNVAWTDPGLRFVDLTGDGHADILLAENHAFTWHPSLAETGFGPPQSVATATDEERGPRVVFTDRTETILLADMSGDGLSDIMRIRNGDVCYWPNLGYGRFGTKVAMDGAPWFDSPDQFDPRRLRLADIDGSGVTDIIYLGRDRIRFWFNLSGNGWSDARELAAFPTVDNVATVAAVDLLGNGTACLVWSSPLEGSGGNAMKYVPLMAEGKPHLLISTRNNLGAETRVRYAPSTYFYLKDKRDGRSWVTRLPFPVHVVERVETLDRISRNRFVTRYAYHHGYFDGPEREFRGFGMVEQFDTEEFAALSTDDTFPDAVNIDTASHVPPVHTKTWFHTGAFIGAEKIERRYECDYFHDEGVPPLPDTQLPTTVKRRDGAEQPCRLSTEEMRQACRALKGAMLRQEVYARDGSDVEGLPYRVTENNYTIELLQPSSPNRHAVFFTHAREAVTLQYERKLYDVGATKQTDPRITHVVTLATDGYGNVLRTATIAYGRRIDDPLLSAEDRQKQSTTLIVYTERDHTNAVATTENHRAPLPAETRGYEILALSPIVDQGLFGFDALQEQLQLASDGSHDLAYEDFDAASAADEPHRRLIEHTRTLYRRDDLAGPLPLGEIETYALPFENYNKAFTLGLAHATYVASGKLLEAELGADLVEGGYVQVEGDTGWWMPSGRIFLAPEPGATAAQELSVARQHFFMPRRFRDPFHNDTRVRYDDYDLLALETADALQNKLTVGERSGTGAVEPRIDYRLLQPTLITDPNGNRTAVAFDVLGLVAGTSVMGKPDESLGDSLQDFVPDLSQEQIDAFFADPRAQAASLLGNATTRVIYDNDRYFRSGDPAQPTFVATIAREHHMSDLAPGAVSPMQVAFGYSDGFARETQRKTQAEPGPVEDGGPNVTARWVGSGWTVFDNKANPVRRYEPFFSASHWFEFARALGVSATLFYDPLGRVAAALHPNHTFEKTLFAPWRHETWDVNDTVALDPLTDTDVSQYFMRLAPAAYSPTWLAMRTQPAFAALAHQRWPDAAVRTAESRAAEQAVAHAHTPTVRHFDVLGRTFLTLLDNGAATKQVTRVDLDIEGNQRAVIDAKGRIVMRYAYDLAGNRTYQASMDAGERWALHDVSAKPIRAWDSRSVVRRLTYDELRRPMELFVTEGTNERLVQRTVYGEQQGDAANHRTRIFQEFDGAGFIIRDTYDFKGNLLQGRRRYLADYKSVADWQQSPALETETFSSSTTYDALNRLATVTTPDGSTYRPAFNKAGLIKSINVHLQGAESATPFVTNIDYDAKGRRTFIHYANGVATRYAYDSETFRLIGVNTTRNLGFNEFSSQVFADASNLQDLKYSCDPAGNITRIENRALRTTIHDNQLVEPVCHYVYDALYRLTEANGREHIGQTAFSSDSSDRSYRDHPFAGPNADPNDLQALRNYMERYEYDAVGNFERVIHHAKNGDWTRHYEYGEPSLIEPFRQNNRLTGIAVGETTETYSHDEHGNILTMPHLAEMTWDFKDMLKSVNLRGGGIAYYVYDASGRRIRKIVERQNGTRQKERLYFGSYEVYREYGGDGGTVALERETLYVMDDERRVALVETLTRGNESTLRQEVRFQLGDQLDSTNLELNTAGQLISYEEYHPYGTTSYQAARSGAEASSKRHRYTSKERDEETGFYYYGARYYAAWLGRWVSCDPAGISEGVNPFLFVVCNPIVLVDPDGWSPEDAAALRTDLTNAYLAQAHSAEQLRLLNSNLSVLEGRLDRLQGEHVSMLLEGETKLSESEFGQQNKQYEQSIKSTKQQIAGVQQKIVETTKALGRATDNAIALQKKAAKLGVDVTEVRKRAETQLYDEKLAKKGGGKGGGGTKGGGGGGSGGPKGGGPGGSPKGGAGAAPKGGGGSGSAGGGMFGWGMAILNMAFLAYDIGKAETPEQKVDVLKDTARDSAIGAGVIFNLARIPVVGLPLATAATGFSIGYKGGTIIAEHVPDPVHVAVGETIAEPGPSGWGAGPTFMDPFFIPLGKFVIGDVDAPSVPPPPEPVRTLTPQERNDAKLERLKDAY
ncbi:SpvB/TcaC N-terminal domain-containing protein [Mycobacterium decipiens]|nr:SpvB/TcaC N-terminal domain-containing protein [Mycobacterium decipiens]